MTISRRMILGGGMAVAAVALLPGQASAGFFSRTTRLYADPNEEYQIRTRGLAMIPREFRKRDVRHDTGYAPGTIVIDTANRFLYFQQEDGRALRYGVGIGRQGFSWNGTATIRRKARWPDWHPPAAMRRRQPYLPRHVAGGLENPLGARALYLYQGGRDTLYRIHGTIEPESIGRAMSSGCVRMVNEEVVDLYEQVPIGTKVVVI